MCAAMASSNQAAFISNSYSCEDEIPYEVPVEASLNEYPWFHRNIDVISAESMLRAQNKVCTRGRVMKRALK